MPSLGGWEWILLLIVPIVLPVVGAITGYRLGVNQGRAKVTEWQQGRPLDK